MNLPKTIVVQLVSDSSINLGNIIVMLKVQSGTKNPYYIQFPKTNLQGVAELTQDDFVGQFMDHHEEGVMDYNGTILRAEPMVEVSLFDPTWSINNKKLALAWPLLKHETTKWKTRKEEYNNRITCRNLEFSAKPVSINIENTNPIKLKVAMRADTHR